jgi:putative membrane protein (TIGR04086 family)
MIYQNNGRFIFMKKTDSAKKASDKKLLLCALRGLFVGIFCAIIFAAVFCLIGHSMDDPNKYVKIFAFISLLAPSFAGGFATARERGAQTILCGACTSLFLLCVMVLFTLGFALPINAGLFGISAPCVLICGIFGANMGVGSKKHKSKR